MQMLKIWARIGDKTLLHNFSTRIGMSFILKILHSNSLLMTASTCEASRFVKLHSVKPVNL